MGSLVCQVTEQFEEAFPEFVGIHLVSIFLALVATCFRNRSQLQGLIDFVEFNAGVGHVTKGVLAQGLFAVAVDKVFSPSHNCTSPEGMRFWFEILLYVRQHGHAWFAPDCSSWVWICRHVHGRGKGNIMGHLDFPRTRIANEISYFQSALLLLCFLLDITYLIEQPLSSLLDQVPHIIKVLDLTEATYDITWLGAYGGSSPKCLKFYTTCSWVSDLYLPRPAPHPDRRLAVKKGKKVTGIRKALKASAIYPALFGAKVGQLFAQAL